MQSLKTYKTLDGKSWDRNELLEKMLDDSFYYGYLGENAFSSTAIKQMLKGPRAYRDSLYNKQEETQALRDGKLIHTLLLEPEREGEYTVIKVASKASKAYKEAASENGKETTVTAAEMQNAKNIAAAVRQNGFVNKILEESHTERPAFGYINYFPFRAKADIIQPGEGIYDLKTVTDIHSFRWNAKAFGYDVQVYIYCMLFNIPFTRFKFIVVDKKSYELGYFSVSEEFYRNGAVKVAKALNLYTEYFKEGKRIEDHLLTGEL